MVVNRTGTRGQPIIDNPPRRRADLQAVSDYAAEGRGLIVGTSTDRMALTSSDLFDGLHFFETDNHRLLRYDDDNGGWGDAHAARDVLGTDIFTPSSGWDRGTGTAFARVGVDRLQVYGSFRRTGGALKVDSTDGNVTNTTVGRLSIAPTAESGFTSGRSGRLASFMADTAGLVQIVATTPGSTIATGEYLSFAGSYPYL